ncbi:carotenoid 1,2-hydratase [Aquabacterium sp. A7-Y]|nr:carotenoid 1,2-hydratase [Aquabacterium sp. A7-Y]MCW7537629.1 carotenoid 1,2-hydratase [Aquabacterium sp. A7-Y]
MLAFPRDFGAHPEHRTEWWYITGRLQAPGEARPFGFQITFFRSRVDAASGTTSRFAATQLVFAHAALTDLGAGRLLHDQRIARAGFGIAGASTMDTDVKLRDWRLTRFGPPGQSRYRGVLTAAAFALELDLNQTQPLLLQGDAGYSQKGPLPQQASHYYSQPQLAVQGRVRVGDRWHAVQGRAWLDHEWWSEALLDPSATGWDWIGMNLDDGGALCAFRLRRADGSTLWAGGSFRPAGSPSSRSFAAEEVHFLPGPRWTSPATRASYPVRWTVETPVGRYTVRALLENQELDSRGSTGAVYWEGLSELLDAAGRRVGHGYLEMTGYADRLRL